MQIDLDVLGVVRSPQTEAVDEGWGDIESTIELRTPWKSGLQGLEDFSHVWILTWLHEAQFKEEKHLTRHPRGDQSLPKVGIFAQRARHRPNRIGITACPIVSVDAEKGLLKVTGLDAIDGTPVIDIKPYVGAFDTRESQLPDWMRSIMGEYF